MSPRGFAVILASALVVQASHASLDARRHAAAALDMKAHFVQVGVVHEAVIRGDLAAARAAATMLERSEAAGLAPELAAQYQAMRALAGRVSNASDVAGAAAGAAALLGACGDCHRVSGAMPAPALPARPTVGQAVGHMLDHQRAADQLMQGLVVPSSALWNMGAQGLRAAPLATGKLPKDPKLTSEVAAGEKRVHELADRASRATETRDRVEVYGQVLATCAGCHSIHGTIWGPTGR